MGPGPAWLAAWRNCREPASVDAGLSGAQASRPHTTVIGDPTGASRSVVTGPRYPLGLAMEGRQGDHG